MWGTGELDLYDVKNVDVLRGLFLITQVLTERLCKEREIERYRLNENERFCKTMQTCIQIPHSSV